MKYFVVIMMCVAVFVMCGYVCLISREVALGFLFMVTGIILSNIATTCLVGQQIRRLRDSLKEVSRSSGTSDSSHEE